VRGIGVCRKHKLVRHALAGQALVAQREALVHAEAVLLVDDRQPERVEAHAFLHQRVRANHNLRSPAAISASRGGALRGR
jgi:hypothetical protein